MSKVLFCSLQNEYGQPNAGPSFEYQNLYDCLRRMPGVEAQFFATDDGLRPHMRDQVNQQLISTVQEQRPDLLFCFLFTEELKKETIDFITRRTTTKTFNWFADDHWRFAVYSKLWAPLFTAVSTTDSQAVKKYERLGIKVMKTQWAANPYLYFPQDSARNSGQFKVTFVGKCYGNRGAYLDTLKHAGLPAQGFGSGWDSGRIEEQTMLDIFSFSKINLNFTETPYITWKDRLKVAAKLFVKKELGTYKANFQFPIANFQSALGTQRRQIKGRTFEVPACGGFLLTGNADNLGDYYQDGKEIVIFRNVDDLIVKCRYYLEHESERQKIGQAGYERTLREHTYEKRFVNIFEKLGV